MKVCEVDIFGDKYALRAEIDDGSVRHLAYTVDSRMRDVANASPTATPLQIAVLAALDIASENAASSKETDQNKGDLDKMSLEVEFKAQKMLEQLQALTS